MLLPRSLSAALGFVLLAATAGAATDPIPLNTLGTNKYEGFVGGLYADGRNEPGGAHAEALRRMNSAVTPLNAEGKPDPSGKIVIAGIGASVCNQIFQTLEELGPNHPGINPAVAIVNCSKGGQDVNKIADASGRYWKMASSALEARGFTPKQVQFIWYQSDDLDDTRDDFPGRPQRLKDDFAEQLRMIKTNFPNARICYFSGRHTTAFMSNPAAMKKHGEPRPYHNGWATKWLIEEQSAGRKDLRFDGADAVAPLAAWATYFWTDGDKPRHDGYRWTRDDVVTDGVHLSKEARPRVANELLVFWSKDEFAKQWFMAKGKELAATAPASNPAVALTKQVKTTSPEGPAWIVNGSNKMPKLERLLATTDGVRVIIRDVDGKQVREIKDVFNARTDLNQAVGAGQFRLEFYDKKGERIQLTQEVGEVLRLK